MSLLLCAKIFEDEEILTFFPSKDIVTVSDWSKSFMDTENLKFWFIKFDSELLRTNFGFSLLTDGNENSFD